MFPKIEKEHGLWLLSVVSEITPADKFSNWQINTERW